MLIEIDELGFGDVTLTANYMTASVSARQNSTGVYVRNISSTIETALSGLVEAIKMFNSFPEKTRDAIQKQQMEEERERERLIDAINTANLSRIKGR